MVLGRIDKKQAVIQKNVFVWRSLKELTLVASFIQLMFEIDTFLCYL